MSYRDNHEKLSDLLYSAGDTLKVLVYACILKYIKVNVKMLLVQYTCHF